MGARNIVSDDEEEYEEDDVREPRDRQAVDEEDEEDEEEEGQDEYEKDDFIVDDVEEEEEEEVRESSDEETKIRKKKKKKREAEENYELDEDDYELLQEANVTGFHRPKSGSKKFKRLKKAGRNDDIDERTGFSDEDELDEGGRTGATAEEKLKRSLFGDDEGAPPEDVAEEEDQLMEEEDEDMGEEDEMADFIVDEEEVDENGIPLRSLIVLMKEEKDKKKNAQASSRHFIFGIARSSGYIW
uniref:Spt6 acidic N-terminal domain-containing protein n=1 Tax=Araucaria cunninghamii TaxID=56994 RepID=A0A0D6QUC1_ARACU